MPEILRKLPEHLLLIHALRERERKREREREERRGFLIWLFEYFFLIYGTIGKRILILDGEKGRQREL